MSNQDRANIAKGLVRVRFGYRGIFNIGVLVKWKTKEEFAKMQAGFSFVQNALNSVGEGGLADNLFCEDSTPTK